MKRLALITTMLLLLVCAAMPVQAQECDWDLVALALIEPDEAGVREMFESVYLPLIDWLENNPFAQYWPEGKQEELVANAQAQMEQGITDTLAEWTAFYNSEEAEELRNSRCARYLLWYWAMGR